MGKLAEYLMDQGLRPALITNDQGSDLVDTDILRSGGFDTEEITGGCFCCRFDQLIDTAVRLFDRVRPDVLVAEAVGSCTDLAATVTDPLRRIYGDRYTVAPLSVVVDGERARQVLGLAPSPGFTDGVEYIYRKQLEEADLIAINKADCLDRTAVDRLRAKITGMAPDAEIHVVSTRTGVGLSAWFHRLVFGRQQPRPLMEIDYDRYAAGEARLGWLNAVLSVDADAPVDGDTVLRDLAVAIQGELGRREATVAHLKMTLHPTTGDRARIGTVNLVGGGLVPELGLALGRAVTGARIIVNLRAEGAPDLLEKAVARAVEGTAHAGLDVDLMHVECFSPGRPQPTHGR